MLALFIGGTIWIYNLSVNLVGSDKAWPVLAEVMPYGDEKPKGYSPTVFDPVLLQDSAVVRWFLEKGGPGMSEALVPADGHRVLVILEDANDSRPKGSGTRVSLWQLGPGDQVSEFAPPGTFDAMIGQPREGAEEIQLTLQGRVVTGERADIEGQEIPLAGVTDIQELVIDISEGRERPLLLRMLSTGEVKATEEELNRFLEPFQVWPDSPR